MGQHWGPRTGHRSCLSTTRLAKRLRIAGLQSTELTARLVTALRGESDGGTEPTFTPDEARLIAAHLNRTARRMWWTPAWRLDAQLIASDAHLAWCEGRDWVIA